MSFLGMPSTPAEMIVWLIDHPEADWNTVRIEDDFLVGLRDEAGALSAYHCRIKSEDHEDGPRDPR